MAFEKMDKIIPQVEVPAQLRGPAAEAVDKVIKTPPNWRTSAAEKEALEQVKEQRRQDGEQRWGTPAGGDVQHDITQLEARAAPQVAIEHVAGEQQAPVVHSNIPHTLR